MKRPSKRTYIQRFGIVVIVLALVRCVFPQISGNGSTQSVADSTTVQRPSDSEDSSRTVIASQEPVSAVALVEPSTSTSGGTDRKHRILSVPSFKAAFPDSNSVQLEAARRWGVSPVKNRQDAETRKKDLVYVGASPYYFVDRLGASIPYLVPHAALLLQDIGAAFYDSLYVKGVPLHQLIVTSVLRTQEDVLRLRRFNGNATENSCHLYGTTFDICYNRYKTIQDPEGPALRQVQNDTLKWVLSEVLNDFRQQGRCYVKYEVKQGCFHMTVR